MERERVSVGQIPKRMKLMMVGWGEKCENPGSGGVFQGRGETDNQDG